MATKTLPSPAGILLPYPHLNEPDTKFDAAGEFNCRLRLPQEKGEEFQAKLQAMYDEFYAAEYVRLKKKVLKKSTELPFKPHTDDDGEETGDVIFKFKAKASGVSSKTQKPWSRKLVCYDAKKSILDPIPAIWGGSKVRLGYEPHLWNTALGVGMTLRLNSVQVIDLKSGGGRDFSDVFDEEEGYEHASAKAEEFPEEDTAEATSGSTELADDPTAF